MVQLLWKTVCNYLKKLNFIWPRGSTFSNLLPITNKYNVYSKVFMYIFMAAFIFHNSFRLG
jgi:hypothetical protein